MKASELIAQLQEFQARTGTDPNIATAVNREWNECEFVSSRFELMSLHWLEHRSVWKEFPDLPMSTEQVIVVW
jgi:hypothetical protein